MAKSTMTKKELQYYWRQYNQRQLLRLRNVVYCCHKERYQNASEELKEKIPQILDQNKKRTFSGIDNTPKDEYNMDIEELESLRLMIAYYKNEGKFNNRHYCEKDIEKLDNIIDHLKETCVDRESDLQLITIDNPTDAIKIHNRLIMCHNIISAYSTGILQNTHFRLFTHPSKNNIEITYKCNYKKDMFTSNEKIMSNFQCTRLVDRYKKFKSGESFRDAKFSNSIKMVSLEKNVGYNCATLCSLKK